MSDLEKVKRLGRFLPYMRILIVIGGFSALGLWYGAEQLWGAALWVGMAVAQIVFEVIYLRLLERL